MTPVSAAACWVTLGKCCFCVCFLVFANCPVQVSWPFPIQQVFFRNHKTLFQRVVQRYHPCSLAPKVVKTKEAHSEPLPRKGIRNDFVTKWAASELQGMV